MIEQVEAENRTGHITGQVKQHPFTVKQPLKPERDYTHVYTGKMTEYPFTVHSNTLNIT